MRCDFSDSGTIDGLSVFLHPFPYFLKAQDSGLRKLPVRLRADIEKQVGVFAGSPHQKMDQVLSALVVLVRNLVPPHSVHGLTCLERKMVADRLAGKACLVLSRKIPFENLDVFSR